MILARRKIAYWLYEKYSFMKILMIFMILMSPLLFKMILIFFYRRHVEKKAKKDITVGFFHPNCNACTPQENVLWSAVKAIQTEYDNVQICIYTGDLEAKPHTILSNVESKFGIKLQPNIRFLYLRKRKWIRSFAYLGSMWVGCEALSLLKPHIMIDSMGYGFCNFIFKYCGRCTVINYVHNPLVSVDKLKTRYVIHSNNQYIITRRPAFSLGVSKGIAFLWGKIGRVADVVMVNSSWTKENILNIWNCPQKAHIVYPPIGLENLMKRADSCLDKKNQFRIMNASEFKPENNHELILRALNKARLKIKRNIMDEVRLVLINLSSEPCESYVQRLKEIVKQQDLEDYVKIYPQSMHSNRLEEELIKATFGIYAKVDDEFGSDLIAGLTTGQIMIVHASGAAKAELINTEDESRSGYLVKTVDDYAHALEEALHLSPADKRRMQKASRRIADQFSRFAFQKEFLKIIGPFLESKKKKLYNVACSYA
ncbi:hypothetical protein QAD02_010090 [Eretmocerus hayati]|uniref:Uncharacterized protein n=1 Tax=Eretmocerus hayati TaxID=131215 RepID=A0ACC2NDM9_9HYME|nr:hypothetical protein QAD02_010090 [Eretmocerus hayati]